MSIRAYSVILFPLLISVICLLGVRQDSVTVGQYSLFLAALLGANILLCVVRRTEIQIARRHVVWAVTINLAMIVGFVVLGTDLSKNMSELVRTKLLLVIPLASAIAFLSSLVMEK